MTAKRVCHVGWKMTFFREFCYLNSSRITKSITLKLMSSSKNKFTLLWQNSVTDVSVGFHPPCWCWSRWAPAWRLHTNLDNLGRTFLQISRVRNIPLTWNLARVFAYLPPFICQILGLIFWTVLIFILIYCEWHDTENQQYYKRNLSKKKRIEKNRPLKVRKYYKIGKLPKI